jgi:hypothetical protein
MQEPWFFEIPNREYAGYDAAKQKLTLCTRSAAPTSSQHWLTSPKIDRAAIVEIMNGNTDVDLADIFFQTVVFKERCYYHSLPPDLAEKFKCKTVLHLAPPTHLW